MLSLLYVGYYSDSNGAIFKASHGGITASSTIQRESKGGHLGIKLDLAFSQNCGQRWLLGD